MVLTNTPTSPSSIKVQDDRILIHHLEITEKDAVDYLRQLPEEERDRACIRAVEIGLRCLETTQNSRDTEFVRRQIQSLLAEVEKAVGVIPDTLQKELIGKLGTADGQVLAPCQVVCLLFDQGKQNYILS